MLVLGAELSHYPGSLPIHRLPLVADSPRNRSFYRCDSAQLRVKPITTSPPKQFFRLEEADKLTESVNLLLRRSLRFDCLATVQSNWSLYGGGRWTPLPVSLLFRDRAGLHHGMFRNWGGLLSELFQIARDFGGRFLLNGVLKGFWLWWYGFFHFEVTCSMSRLRLCED